MKYVGVDIGGMSVKVGVVSEKGEILFKKSAICHPERQDSDIAAEIAALINAVIEKSGMQRSDIAGIGIADLTLAPNPSLSL